VPSRVNRTPAGDDASVRFYHMKKTGEPKQKKNLGNRNMVIKGRVKQEEKRSTGFHEANFLKNYSCS
jgi:hypothetical protein